MNQNMQIQNTNTNNLKNFPQTKIKKQKAKHNIKFISQNKKKKSVVHIQCQDNDGNGTYFPTKLSKITELFQKETTKGIHTV